MSRRTLIILTVLLLAVFGAFIAEAALVQEVCIAGQITDGVDTTFYDEVCT